MHTEQVSVSPTPIPRKNPPLCSPKLVFVKSLLCFRRCAVMRVTCAALGKALRGSPQLAERLALAVTSTGLEREEAKSGNHMTVHVTVVRARALPEDYDLG